MYYRPGGSGEEPKNWFINRRGDESITTYGGLYRIDVPIYRRFGARIIGAADKIRINHKASQGKKGFVLFPVGGKRDDETKTRYQVFRKQLRQKPVSVPRLLASASTNLAVLPSSQPLQPITSPSQPAQPNEHSEDFLPLLDFDDVVGAEDKGTEETFDAELAEDAEFAKRSQEFNKVIQKDPNNVDLWLSFIDFQNKLLESSTATAAAGSKKGSLSRAVNSKKLSIFEKALTHLPEDERLLGGYMRFCEEAWESTALLTKWDEILELHPGSRLLWKQYIDFRQTHFTSFSFSTVVEVFSQCIRTMEEAHQEQDGAGSRQEVEETLLYFFTRACHMMKQAGYIERAVATFQAQIEFSCFCPAPYARQTFSQRVEMLETFWDSEMPRFGEEDATGWANSLFKDQDIPVPSGESRSQQSMDLKDEYRKWEQEETLKEFSAWLPARTATADEEDLEDPYRTVLFDDVRPFLFDATLPHTRSLLIQSFLQLLGIPMNNIQPHYLYSTHSSPSSDYNNESTSHTGQQQISTQARSGSQTSLPIFAMAVAAGQRKGMEGSEFGFVGDPFLHVSELCEPMGGYGPGRFYPLEQPTTLGLLLQGHGSADERAVTTVSSDAGDGAGLVLQPPGSGAAAHNMNAFGFPLKTYPLTVDCLFGNGGGAGRGNGSQGRESGDWFAMVDKEDVKGVEVAGDERLDFIRRIFMQTRKIFPQNDTYLETFLVLEAAHGAKSARKVAKSLLKQERNNFSLWNTFAKMEAAAGNAGEARKVYQTALAASRTLPRDSSSESDVKSALLYRSFAELEWDCGKKNAALSILVAFAEDNEKDIAMLPAAEEDVEEVRATKILKARKVRAVSYPFEAYGIRSQALMILYGALLSQSHIFFIAPTMKLCSQRLEKTISKLLQSDPNNTTSSTPTPNIDSTADPASSLPKSTLSALHEIACISHFEYLSQGLDEACKVYDRVLQALEDERQNLIHLRRIREYQQPHRQQQHPSHPPPPTNELINHKLSLTLSLTERILEMYARLLYRHSTSLRAAFKPGTMRSLLEDGGGGGGGGGGAGTAS
ncbi:Protein nrde2, partial [Quaeritorhiza haematococci]